MKKTYINPTLEVVKFQTAGMLAVSQAVSDTEFDSKKGSVFGRENDFDED